MSHFALVILIFAFIKLTLCSGYGTPMNLTDDEKLLLYGGFLQLLLQSSETHSVCHNFTQFTLHKAEEQVPWATKMVDSSFKMPSGIQDGNLAWLGSFSECSSIQASDWPIEGQYCLLYVTPSPSPNQSQPFPKWYPPPSFIGTPLKIGLCVPSSCSPQQVEMAARSAIGPSLKTSLSSRMCQSGTDRHVDAAAISMICVLCVIIAMVLVATFMDVLRRKSITNLGPKSQSVEPLQSTSSLNTTQTTDAAIQVILSFSLCSNWDKLCKDRKSSANDISLLHGIRFLSITWIILGHTYGMNLNNAWTNSEDLPKMAPDFSFQVVLNGTIGVDSFLFLSGLLISVGLLRQMTKTNGRLSVHKFLLRRYLRLVPAYAIVIGFAATLWQYFGKGPTWPEMLTVRDDCRDNWWTNLLFVNNFVHPTHMCLNFSWFLANDMQLALVAPIFVYLLFRWPKVGIAVSCVSIICQWLALGAVAYIFNLAPSTGFLIGIFTGYIIHRRQMRKDVQPSNNSRRCTRAVAAVVGWVIAAVVGMAVVYGLWHWMTVRQLPHRTVSTVYNALARTAWALALSWITLACLSGYGGIWKCAFGDLLWTVRQDNEDFIMYRVESSKGDEAHAGNELFLRDYFQLDVDLESLYNQWRRADPSNFGQVCERFTGIRMLRQDPVEALFAFICSANNNISR